MYNFQRAQSAVTVIALFVGAGGFSLAELAGIEARAAAGVDAHACSTFGKNLVDAVTGLPVLIESDANGLLLSDLFNLPKRGKVEFSILLGDPRCQGFSTHRLKEAGVGDPRYPRAAPPPATPFAFRGFRTTLNSKEA
jgi:DNA (cytosine-5)-methyltransferase 1